MAIAWNIPGRATTPKPVSTVPDFFGRTPEAAQVVNPISLPKIPGADPAIHRSFMTAEELAKTLWGDAGAYRAGLAATDPNARGFANEEIADLGRVFSPDGYAADLSRIRQGRASALSKLSDTVLADIRRALNLGAIGRGGVSGSGLGSWMTRSAANEAARVRASEAVDAATQERNDLQALLAARTAATGRRTSVMDSVLNRLLSAGAVDTNATSASDAALLRALQAALTNTTSAYGMAP